MSDFSLRLPLAPESAGIARRFVSENAPLDSMRLTEASLLITELVTNAVDHASKADELEVGIGFAGSSSIRFEVSHAFSGALEHPEHGLGFTLLDRIGSNWGYDAEGETLSVWFELRAPGTTLALDDLSDADLMARFEDDPAYAAELVTRHQDLARSIARRYRGKGVPEGDLEQVAMMALLKAIQRFDPELGELRSFASVTISGELKRALRDRGWAVRVPRSLQERSLEVAAAIQDMNQELGRTPTNAQVAERLGITVEEVAHAMSVRSAYSSRSLDAPNKTTGVPLSHRLEELDTALEETPGRSTLESAISSLPEREREILHLRFQEDLTQREIAEIVGISQMHVSRLLSKSLSMLREILD